MDCLRSFSLTILDQNTYTSASSALTVWGTNNSFAVYSTDSSTFLIQGFKNINVFKIDMIGNVSTAYGSAPRVDNANATDFEIGVQLVGQIPQPIGVIGVPNDLPIIQNTFIEQIYTLSKYKTSVEFSTPIQSVKSISFYDFKAFGSHVQNILQVKMGYQLQFIFYYQFEGE
jgi:hypothetical protein